MYCIDESIIYTEQCKACECTFIDTGAGEERHAILRELLKKNWVDLHVDYPKTCYKTIYVYRNI
ncbi:hypothetical protein FACS1894105_11270 [Clostridia bacterium]|nr:hypothetical protein FACS1894105_11210 [Clostridia bacterium]GHU38038.1 hypothetical protein FACS1894105_11270 [Clostridia bacterium]